MLIIRDLAKGFKRHGKLKMLFEGMSFGLAHGDRLGLLGRNGQGKSTLIKILGGVTAPDAGEVEWSLRASWPIGFGGGFQGGLSGLDNIRFLARIYDRPLEYMIEKVERFAELEDALYMPVKHYSTGMRARLAFGLSLAIEFDCYLIDEVVAVGDAIFRNKCDDELFNKRHDRGFVIASHDTHFLRATCNRGLIIEGGHWVLYEDINQAADAYEQLCVAG